LAGLLISHAVVGCDWIKLRAKGSEHGVDWGVGFPL